MPQQRNATLTLSVHFRRHHYLSKPLGRRTQLESFTSTHPRNGPSNGAQLPPRGSSLERRYGMARSAESGQGSLQGGLILHDTVPNRTQIRPGSLRAVRTY